MTLITNKRSYEFVLKSVNDDDDSNIYVARFTYDSPVLETVEQPSLAPVSLSPTIQKPSTRASYNYNYTYSGNDKIAPDMVYDDGASTTIIYKDLASNLPITMSSIDSRGTSHPVSVKVQDNSLVVSSVSRELVVKGTGGEIKIYNEARK